MLPPVAHSTGATLLVGGQQDRGAATSNLAEAGRWLRLANQARGTAIAGGSTFIQRNIVAERILGLPRS